MVWRTIVKLWIVTAVAMAYLQFRPRWKNNASGQLHFACSRVRCDIEYELLEFKREFIGASQYANALSRVWTAGFKLKSNRLDQSPCLILYEILVQVQNQLVTWTCVRGCEKRSTQRFPYRPGTLASNFLHVAGDHTALPKSRRAL